MGLVHIDAHCDTGGPFEGSKFHHGGPFRQAVLAGVLDPERTIQIGIRGGAEYLWEFSYESGMTVIHAEEFQRAGIARTIEKIRKVVGDGPTYVSFDVDSLDPAFAPGTGTPEAGGLSTREAMELVRGCAGLDIVGGDVVEVAPQYDADQQHRPGRRPDAVRDPGARRPRPPPPRVECTLHAEMQPVEEAAVAFQSFRRA